MGIKPLPVSGQNSQIQGQNFRGQMLDANPGENKEADVVYYLVQIGG